MVMAAKKTIVEVEEIVPAGELKADDIHVPGVYVDYIYKPSKEEYNKVIERLVYDPQTYKEYPGNYILT
jgi:acyl CoA:acetate/3-ketoacid CoA transferase